MTLSLLLLIIPIIGSIIGLIGKSWDEGKTTKIKFTLRGWISLTVILFGLGFTTYKTIHTENENDMLKEQKNHVRSLVYSKLYGDCLAAIRPIEIIYLEQTKRRINHTIDDEFDLCIEMTNDSSQRVFKNCNLLESVQEGVEFEKWDKSYADFLIGYYNSNYPYTMENTMTRWANYIDMEDLLVIDTIINHSYWITLKSVNYGHTEKERQEFLKNPGVLFYYEDEDILKEQNDFLLKIATLIKKSKKYIAQQQNTRKPGFGDSLTGK